MHTFVFGHGQQFVAFWIKSHAPNLIRVIIEGVETLLRGRVPNFDRAVSRGRHKPLIIRRKGHREDPRSVSGQSGDETAVPRVIHLQMTVIRTGEQLLRVRGKGQRPDWHRVTFEGVQQRPGFGVEDRDDPVDGAGGHRLAVRGVSHRKGELPPAVERRRGFFLGSADFERVDFPRVRTYITSKYSSGPEIYLCSTIFFL